MRGRPRADVSRKTEEGSTIIASVKVASERRSAAPHPGPILKAEFFDPIGLTVPAFALKVGMDPKILEEMLAGRAPIDVPTAIRIARTLQAPAEQIMQMQLKFEFALARNMPELRSLEVHAPQTPQPFPSVDFISGRLGLADGDAPSDGSFFFQEHIEHPEAGDHYAGLHALWRGDRLRVRHAEGADVLWIGPVLQNLDGRLLLPYAKPDEWHAWFAAGYRADLALGDDHRAFFRRMNE
jgi:addiction module HigA family antidote